MEHVRSFSRQHIFEIVEAGATAKARGKAVRSAGVPICDSHYRGSTSPDGVRVPPAHKPGSNYRGTQWPRCCGANTRGSCRGELGLFHSTTCNIQIPTWQMLGVIHFGRILAQEQATAGESLKARRPGTVSRTNEGHIAIRTYRYNDASIGFAAPLRACLVERCSR